MEAHLLRELVVETLTKMDLYDLIAYYDSHKVPKQLSQALFQRRFRHLTAVIPTRDAGDLVRQFKRFLARVRNTVNSLTRYDPNLGYTLDINKVARLFKISSANPKDNYLESDIVKYNLRATLNFNKHFSFDYKKPDPPYLESFLEISDKYGSAGFSSSDLNHYLADVFEWLLTLKANNPDLIIEY